MPYKDYCEKIVENYNKKSYTLDVMVRANGGETDIVELHDMFSCGLYGFNHPKLLDMMIATQKELLRN